MIPYQQDLYDKLMVLVNEGDTFFFADHYTEQNTRYRIFNYRLSSYTEFLKPGALECRGVMYEMGIGDTASRLAALPIHKFFNLYENPFTMDLDISTLKRVMVKSDGSLISTYLNDGQLRLKSKGSLASDQAIDAMIWLDLPEHHVFKTKLLHYTAAGYTVNMEWVSPTNRIVLGYLSAQLIVLNIRSISTGEYIDPLEYSIHPTYVTDFHVFVDAAQSFIDSVPEMQKIEGFVCMLQDGTLFKVKTAWYLALHHTKDSINCPRRLYESVLEEATDDMRSLFHDDELAIKLIDEMEHKVGILYNQLVNACESFYTDHNHMDRKNYALAAQSLLPRKYLGLVMNMYLGKSYDFKDFMKKNWKYYGFQDTVTENLND